MTQLARPRTRLAVALVALALSTQVACEAGRDGATGAAGMGSGASGQTGSDAGPNDAAANDTVVRDAAEEPIVVPPGCVETPTPLRASGATLSLPINLRFEGKPFVFGEQNMRPAGDAVLPLNLRFYVSRVALLRATGAPVPVDLVGAAGPVEPWGVHLYNADDAASQTLRVLAPAGAYTGISFTLGLDDACNSGMPAMRTPPLTDTSQMVWPHFAGYLFLRYEGQVFGASTPPIPPAVHMGGVPGSLFAPTVTVPGAFSIVAGQPATKALDFDAGAVFTGATADVDPATLSKIPFPLPEILAGERLRQHVPDLTLFRFAP